METVKGLQKLLTTLKKVPKELEGTVDKLTEARAQLIERDAKANAPRDKNKLREGIKTLKIGPLTYKVITNANGLSPYAPLVEHGTAPHIIRPKNKSVLRFEIGGRVIFTKEVKHPGSPPRPFLFPAFFKQRTEYIKDLEQLLKSTFGKI